MREQSSRERIIRSALRDAGVDPGAQYGDGTLYDHWAMRFAARPIRKLGRSVRRAVSRQRAADAQEGGARKVPA